MKKFNLVAICGIAMMLMASCSTSRATYGNQYQDHGWGTESKCGKKKPGKWQRYKVDRNNNSYEIDRNGNVQCHTWW